MSGLHDVVETVQREAAWVFSNIASSGYSPTILQLLYLGLLPHLKEALEICRDQTTLKNLVVVCDRLLGAGNEMMNEANPVIRPFNETGCLDALEKSQVFAGKETYSQICWILEKYFGFQEEDYELDEIPNSGFVF